MSYRYKDSSIDAYGGGDNVIHFKFGDARKQYSFTEEFRAKYPKFCAEYDKYWYGKESKFKDVVELVNYIERFDIPVHLYSNYVDEEFEDAQACKEWIMAEHIGDLFEDLDK